MGRALPVLDRGSEVGWMLLTQQYPAMGQGTASWGAIITFSDENELTSETGTKTSETRDDGRCGWETFSCWEWRRNIKRA